jgi:5'-methylthioadenosine phosphorylase
VCDQFVDRTRGRRDTYYDGPITTHISTADPYCPELGPLAVECARKLGIPVHDGGTVVVIQGPRFSTKSESRWFTSMGWEVINMTQYPECVLARELSMCYVNIALITDYDAGVVVESEAVTHAGVLETLRANAENARRLCLAIIESIPPKRGCACSDSLKGAR